MFEGEVRSLVQMLEAHQMEKGLLALHVAMKKHGFEVDQSGPVLLRLVRAALMLMDTGDCDEATVVVTLLYEMLKGDLDPVAVYSQFGEEAALLAAKLDRYLPWADEPLAEEAAEETVLLKAMGERDGVRNTDAYLSQILADERAARIEAAIRLQGLYFRHNLLSHLVGFAEHTRAAYLPFLAKAQAQFPQSQAFFTHVRQAMEWMLADFPRQISHPLTEAEG